MNLPFDLKKTLDGLASVTLRGGVFGKVTFAVCVVSIAIALVAWTTKNEWVAGGALLAIVVFAFPMLWRIMGIAEKNPEIALLEGAQFLIHQQMVHAAKGMKTLPADLVEKEAEALGGASADPAIAQQPDIEDARMIPQPAPARVEQE